MEFITTISFGLKIHKFKVLKKKNFIKHFFKDKKKIGAVSPSSKFLAKKMLQNVNYKKTKVMVELGSGTGVFTRKIVSNMADDAKLLVFELHKPFYNQLAKEFADDERVIVVHDSAEKLRHHLEENGLEKVDIVLSSLPLANFKIRLIHQILSNTKEVLKDQGTYVQFQYSLKSKKIIERFFSRVDVAFTSRNIPPAFVYTCRK